MARNLPIVSFNGGEIGEEVLLRTSLETYGSSAAILENFWPKPAGPMVFRSGLKFCVELDGTKRTRGLAFVFDTQTYGILLSEYQLRIEQGGGVISRSAVTATILDASFTGAIGWTNISTGSATAAGGVNGLVLQSNGTDVAGRRQAITLVEVGSAHGLRVHVARGPVSIRLGSTAGGDEYLRTDLGAGVHSLGVTPTTGTLWIEFSSTADVQRIVTSIAFEAAGDMVLPTPWTEAQLPSLRHDQSNDVVYVTSGVGQGKRIERRSSSSWSVVDTREIDGPYLDPNTDESYTLTPSVRSGNGTLTASRGMFLPSHVGALWSLTHSGQFVSRVFSGLDQSSEYVKVQGVGESRRFNLVLAGTFTATLTLQRSIGNTTSWTNVTTYAGPTTTTYLDGATFDNQTVYYRLRSTAYASGSATASLEYTGGSTSGGVRITSYTSPTVVDMEVVDQLGAITATTEWAEGAWSDRRSWPKAVALYDGRLWRGGYYDRFWGSRSDAYESHASGDAPDDAIARNVAIGSARRILSFLPLARLVILTAHDSADVEPVVVQDGSPVIKSSAFDEPLTPTNLTIRSTMAARGIYIDSDGHRAMETYYSVEAQDYAQRTLMRLHERLGRPGLTEISVSRRPDRRLMFVRSDGQLLTKLYDPGENVLGWARTITDGVIESTYVKPATGEDEVMVIVRRTIGGQTRRYLEQFDPLHITTAAAANRVDSYVRRDDAGGFTVMTGLGHLEGKTVKIMVNGAAHPDQVVTGAQITLGWTATSAVAGLGYTGRYQSAKLALAAQAGTPLGQLARPTTIQVVLQDSIRSVEYGGDFATMDSLADRALSTPLDEASGLWSGTTDPITIPGDHNRDPRLCIRVQSPFPYQINGMIVGADMHERAG